MQSSPLENFIYCMPYLQDTRSNKFYTQKFRPGHKQTWMAVWASSGVLNTMVPKPRDFPSERLAMSALTASPYCLARSLRSCHSTDQGRPCTTICNNQRLSVLRHNSLTWRILSASEIISPQHPSSIAPDVAVAAPAIPAIPLQHRDPIEASATPWLAHTARHTCCGQSLESPDCTQWAADLGAVGSCAATAPLTALAAPVAATAAAAAAAFAAWAASAHSSVLPVLPHVDGVAVQSLHAFHIAFSIQRSNSIGAGLNKGLSAPWSRACKPMFDTFWACLAQQGRQASPSIRQHKSGMGLLAIGSLSICHCFCWDSARQDKLLGRGCIPSWRGGRWRVERRWSSGTPQCRNPWTAHPHTVHTHID